MPIKFKRDNDAPRQTNLSRMPKAHRRILAGLLAGLAVLLLCHLFHLPGVKELSPEAAQQALHNTFAAPSYRFTTVSTVLLDGQQRLFCQLNGEKSGENRHIWGELLGTPLNIYLVEGEVFQQSGMDKSWRKIAAADLAKAGKLVAEIAPETNFSYTETGPITYVGTEELEGQTLHKVELRPVMSDVWIEQYFTDITSTLWLDKNGEYIVKAQTTAVSAENPTVKLIIDNTFGDFGEQMELTAPL